MAKLALLAVLLVKRADDDGLAACVAPGQDDDDLSGLDAAKGGKHGACDLRDAQACDVDEEDDLQLAHLGRQGSGEQESRETRVGV